MSTRSFSTMLNEYLTNEVVFNAVMERSWLLKNIEIDTSYNGGTVPVPFESNAPTSIGFNFLTDTSDIHEAAYIRGTLSAAVEVYGSMLFRQRDLWDGHGKGKEASFIDKVTKQVERFAMGFKEAVSTQCLDGEVLATFTSNGTAGGVIGVDKIDRFQIGQLITLDDGDSAQGDYFVIAVDINTKEITVSATRGGAAANVSAYTVAQSAKIYHKNVLVGGTVTNKFESLRDILLSAANGGAATVHGQTKASYPVLQAYNHDGSTINAANILEKIYQAHSQFKSRARAGMPTKIAMSSELLGYCRQAMEVQKGAFKVSPKDTRATAYGWEEIDVLGVTGGLMTLVGVTELKNDIIMGLDLNSVKFLSVGEMFKKLADDDGNQYYKVRTAGNGGGMSYVVDMACYGQFQCHSPQSNWIIHSVSI